MKRKKFEYNDRSRKSLEKSLQKISENISKLAGSRKSTLKKADIFLLSHKEMARLKKKFLPREKGPPNVLAFPEPKHWPHPEKKNTGLGEIYLNQDLAKGNINELTCLLIHGILHLLGYDHKKKSDRIKMEKLEKKLLNQPLITKKLIS